MAFIRNRWYLAGWSNEVEPGQLLGRRILDEPVVLFRTEAGGVAAIGGRCPHRFAPLHQGVVIGNAVRCPYHGLEFNAAGKCVRNPNGNHRIPPGAQVRAYPLIEKQEALWIWPGESRADEALIPDLSYTVDPAGSCARGLLHVRGNYCLVIDNLMDLTHATYLHPGTLASVEMIEAFEQTVKRDGDHVDYELVARDVPPPSLQTAMLPQPAERIDFFADMHWEPASYLRLTTRAQPAGVNDPTAGAQGISGHLITPETETSAHYFYVTTRDRILEPEAYEKWHAGVRYAFSQQDEPMIHAQQEMMGTADLMSLRPALLSTDAGPIRVRSIIDRLLREEARAKPSPEPVKA